MGKVDTNEEEVMVEGLIQDLGHPWLYKIHPSTQHKVLDCKIYNK